MEKIKFYNRIGIRLTATLVLLVVISNILATAISLSRGTKSAQEREADKLASIATLKENQINNWLAEKKVEVEIFYKDQDFIEETKKMLALHQIENDNQDAKQNRDDFSHQKIMQLWESKIKKNISYAEALLLELDGTVHYSTDPDQIGKIRKNESYFIEGLQKTFLQKMYYDVSLGQPVSIISAPIVYDGQTQAVLALRLDLGNLNKAMLDRSGLGETGETFVVNKFNYSITKLRFKEAPKNILFTEDIKDCIRGNSNQKTNIYDYRGEKVISAYKWNSQNEMCIIAKIDREEALKHLTDIRNTVILILAPMIILLIIIGYFSTSIIANAIHKLHKGTEIIEKGNLNYKVGTKARDEIGQLSRSFDKMTESLKKSRQELEGYSQGLEIKVKERTKELEKAKATLEEKLKELKRFSKLAIGRELKMIELKKKIKELEIKIKNNGNNISKI